MKNIAWIIQGLLVVSFCTVGTMKIIQPIEVLASEMNYINYLEPWIVRSIGLTELLCGLLLVLPIYIKLIPNNLIVFSGAVLSILMFGAIITHIIIGDLDKGIPAIILLLLSGFITIKRKNELF